MTICIEQQPSISSFDHHYHDIPNVNVDIGAADAMTSSSNNYNQQQTIFFRFLNGKTMTLSINPNEEIFVLKQMLLQKAALLDIVASSSPTTLTARSNSKSILPTLLGLLWLSSMITSKKLSPHDLSFMYCGKPLDDEMTLLDYITPNKASTSFTPTIHVMVRLNGGCFMVSATVLGLIMTAIVGSTCTCGLSLIAVPFLLPLLFILPFFCL